MLHAVVNQKMDKRNHAHTINLLYVQFFLAVYSQLYYMYMDS